MCWLLSFFLTAFFDMMLYIYNVSIVSQLAPTGSPSLVNSMNIIQNPVKTCDKGYALIQSLTSQIRKRLEDPKSAGNVNLPYLIRCTEEKNIQLTSTQRCAFPQTYNCTTARRWS